MEAWSPNVVNFHITDKCNYHCQYCFAKFHQNDLPLDKVESVIDSIASFFHINKIADPRINLAGGEPTVYPYLNAVIDYIVDKGIAVTMITNGAALTPEMIRSWRGKVQFIGISADAISTRANQAIGRCHLDQPASPTHYYVLADSIHSNGIGLKVNTVVSKLNLCEDMKSLYDHMNPDKVKFLAMHTVDNVNGKLRELEPTTTEYWGFVARNRPSGRCKVVTEQPGSMRNAYFMINPHGEVYINDGGTERKYGSCLEEPLGDIFKRVPLTRAAFEHRYA